MTSASELEPAEAEDLDLRVTRTPRWTYLSGLILSVLGLGVSAYLTYEHFTSSTTLGCPNTGIDNCLKVTTSTYSEIHGVPVAVLGLVFFAVMIALQTPQAWRSRMWIVRWGRLVWAAVGIGTALWLVHAELADLNAICQWCTSVHIIDLIIFVLTAFGTAATSVPKASYD